MAASASTRHGFRWENDDFSEPSSVLALNVGSFFIDLRTVLKDASIEWAMAGKREVVSQNPLKVRWTRYIDSFCEVGAVDEGDFKTLDNGDELEYGKMVSPDHGGELTYYEEIWRDGSLVGARPGSWIAQSVEVGSDGLGGRTWIGRVGGYFLAMRQVDEKGEQFVVRREDWDERTEGWVEKYTFGDSVRLPVVKDVETEEFGRLEEGAEFKVDGVAYILRAVER